MQAVSDPTGSFLVRTAAFVVNKWDMFCKQNKTEEKRQDYLETLCRRLEEGWIGFTKDDLLTMNARLAAEASTVKVNTPDVKKLCSILKNLWPQNMNEMLNKTLK